MSRDFQSKDKDLVNLNVLTSDKVWTEKENKQGKYTLKKDLNIFGKIEKGSSSFITSTNKFGLNNKFIEDTCNLPKKTKNEVIDLLINKKKKVVYLVKKDKK